MNRAGTAYEALKSKFKKAICRHKNTRKLLIKVNEYINKEDQSDIIKVIVSQTVCKDCGDILSGNAECSMGKLEVPGRNEYKARSGV